MVVISGEMRLLYEAQAYSVSICSISLHASPGLRFRRVAEGADGEYNISIKIGINIKFYVEVQLN